jgi:hypothetical protein
MSDAAELEREAEAARARLSDTADQIRARMSPGQLMDEVLNQFRGGDGNQMLANLRGQVRDNPMALALVGSGLAWLMMGSGAPAQGSSGWGTSMAGTSTPRPPATPYPGTDTGNFATYRLDDDDRTHGTAGSAHGTAGSARGTAGSSSTGSSSSGGLGSAASSLADSVSGSVSGMAHGASDALASARSAVGEGLHEAGDRAQRMAHDLRGAGSDAFGEVRHSAAGMGHQARDTFFDVLEREPLVIGAIGLAVGAAIGAFLPATEVEREHLGSAGEALKEKAGGLVDSGMAKAKEAAAEVYETARDEADRQGLVPGDKPISEKVDAVVQAVGKTAGGIVERTAAEAGVTGSEAGSETGGIASSGTSSPTSRSGTPGSGTSGSGTGSSGTAGSGTASASGTASPGSTGSGAGRHPTGRG